MYDNNFCIAVIIVCLIFLALLLYPLAMSFKTARFREKMELVKKHDPELYAKMKAEYEAKEAEIKRKKEEADEAINKVLEDREKKKTAKIRKQFESGKLSVPESFFADY